MVYDWIILGGGIHGVLMAHWLVAQEKVDVESVCILDSNKAPLEHWRKRTSSVGMSYLRSPSVHHLDMDPFGLRRFSQAHPEITGEPFAPPYDRPSLRLFDEHCTRLFEYCQIESMWHQGTVTEIKRREKEYCLTTEEGDLRCKNLILAIGPGSKLSIPDWVDAELLSSNKVQHVLSESFDRSVFSAREKVLVLGGGISAVQIACALGGSQKSRVALYSRSDLRKHEFDSDPCWMGPKCMRKFDRVKSTRARRKMISRARHKGSISSEAAFHLRNALIEGKLCHKVREVERVELTPSGNLDVSYFDGKPEETFDRIVLATGFESGLPGAEFLDQLIVDEELPIAECGFPLPGQNLEWSEGLYVMGGLAELELGPAARNIIGARKAAERILSSVS